MRVLVGCEYSGRVRNAFREAGHDAWSCDLLPSEDDSPFHIQGDVLPLLDQGWDLGIFHPPCTRLANSGARWLHVPPNGKTIEQMWDELEQGIAFYRALRDSPIKRKAIENPVIHRHAKERLGGVTRHIVQPWWSWVHRASPGPDRWKERSRTFAGVAKAMAEQWGRY